MSTTWIRVAFGPVFGVLVAFSVIFGIAMVTPGPKPPGDPGVTFRQLSAGGGDETNGRGQNALSNQIDQFFGDALQYRNSFPKYQRNVFLAATGLGILVVLIGLGLPAVVNYLRWGFVLGGLMLFIYAFAMINRSVPKVAPEGNSLLALIGAGAPEPLDFASRFLQFVVAFVGLILTLFLGLWRLTEWRPQTRVAARTTSGALAPAGPAAAQWAPPAAPTTTTVAPVPPVDPAPSPLTGEPLPPETNEPAQVRAPEWRRPEG